jgi:hypothetical protein
MRRRFLVSLIVALGVLFAVGSASADSSLTYPDNSRSQAINLGGGQHAFVFFDIPGDNDIFVHPVDFNANFLFVSLNQSFNGFGIWLDFEGFNQGFLQYGVYTCNGVQTSCGFGAPTRRGTLFL